MKEVRLDRQVLPHRPQYTCIRCNGRRPTTCTLQYLDLGHRSWTVRGGNTRLMRGAVLIPRLSFAYFQLSTFGNSILLDVCLLPWTDCTAFCPVLVCPRCLLRRYEFRNSGGAGCDGCDARSRRSAQSEGSQRGVESRRRRQPAELVACEEGAGSSDDRKVTRFGCSQQLR